MRSRGAMDRLEFLLALTASAQPLPAGVLRGNPTEPDLFTAQEHRVRGRLGVCAIDLRDERRIGRRARERFPLASTFKLPLVMDVLSRVDGGIERLDRKLSFGPSAILAYSPVVAKQPRGGSLTIADLCAAAIEHSDNAAANLLLATLGGPPGVTAYLRGVGDPTTRLDRTEPALNAAAPGDVRDTTTPEAMANLLARLVREPILSRTSQATLFGWLRNATTGLARIRAGVPNGFVVGDKTGTTNTGGNDVAILWPRFGPPIVLAVYSAEVHASDADRDAAIAAVAHEVVLRFRTSGPRRRG